jgi:trk system potassium uptake protein TrkH
MVLLVLGAFMLVAAGISYVSGVDSAYSPLLMSSLLTFLIGAFPLIFVPRSDRISQKEGYCIVVGSWVVASFVGMFPYLMWGGEFTLINAWFESVSGFTTTGASILNDIEDFEIFMEQVEHVFHETEGNLSGFYYDELLPLMKKELRRREGVLEDM